MDTFAQVTQSLIKYLLQLNQRNTLTSVTLKAFAMDLLQVCFTGMPPYYIVKNHTIFCHNICMTSSGDGSCCHQVVACSVLTTATTTPKDVQLLV